jgi:hypothetical protein
MNRAIQIAKLIVLLTAAAFLLAGTLLALQARELMDDAVNGWDAIAQHAVAIEQDADDTVNDAHTAVRLTPKLIDDARLSFKNLNSAALDERFYFGTQVPATMSRVDAVIDQSQTMLAAYTRTADTLSVAATGLLPVETNVAKVLTDSDVVIADPKIPALLAHADEAMATTADTAKHVDATSADVQKAVHTYLHPSWASRVTNWVVTAGRALGSWL